MPICVLTGDIVGSTTLQSEDLKDIHHTLATAHRELSALSKPSLHGTYRSDGWQMAFSSPELSLRIALSIRAALTAHNEAFKTRIAVAAGPEDLTSQNIQTANSPTFIASGRALDAMRSDQLMTHAQGGAMSAATSLADHISNGWTSAQARAILPFLQSPERLTQKDVSAKLGISRQAVGQALDAAGYPAIKAALTAIEEQAK